MKYSMVKQFSNGAIDNIYNFFFKIVDFFKMAGVFLWAFLEIWIAFYMIFFNIAMYIYYLLLFLIDRGAEESAPIFRFRGLPQRASYTPRLTITNAPNPVPSIYGVGKAAASTAASAAASTAKTTLTSLRPSPSGYGAKTAVFRTVFEGIADFFIAFFRVLLSPFKAIVLIFEKKVKPVKEHADEETAKGKSIIDEYMKEYEHRKK
ncbi:MAG: hypothetical protein MUD12_07515 [Spirochaetes bacterium]|jgi:hypothetical protein|nr:hypothetical protein [Spirochaetota bacterium]